MVARADICLQRNEDYSREWHLVDESGSPIDVTGCSFTMQVKRRVDNGTVIAYGTVTISDAARGYIQVLLRASTGSPLSSYGSPIQTENLPFDLLMVDVDGIHMPLIAGLIVLSRGTTQP